MSLDTKYSQVDFSGGLNVNSRIGANELQECVNCSLDDIGSIRPDYVDTLLTTVPSISWYQVLDGWIYYLVGTTLSRCTTLGHAAAELGIIGAGKFFAFKSNNVHLIVASNKSYKVINGALTQLGTFGPRKAPTLAKTTQVEKTIETFEDYTDFYILSGTHKAGFANSAFFVDSAGRNFVTLGLVVGMTVNNITDGSSGKITAIGNQDATNDKLTVTLAGGTDNDFDVGDTIQITYASLISQSTKRKAGSYSLKITTREDDVEAEASKVFDSTLDLTEFGDSDDTASLVDDLISFDIYIGDWTKYSSVALYFDCNTGDFENDYFKKTIPLMPSNVDLAINEDWAGSFIDEHQSIYWDGIFGNWQDRTDIESEGFDNNLTNLSQYQNSGNRSLKKKDKRKVASDRGTWSKIKIRKSDFVRQGESSSKGWDTIAAIKITAVGQAGLEVVIDNMKLVGGGMFENDKYAVCYSYVSKFTLRDGTTYEEESTLSPEATITGCERQNIVVSNLDDSSDDQVTHKRIYIRGGGLEIRHKVVDVRTDTSSHTINSTESSIVARSVEDCRLNYMPPKNVEFALYFGGKLYLMIGKRVYWSRALMPSAFRPNDYIDLPSTGVTMFEKGSNLAIVTADKELLYVNPGYGPTEGGYIHYPETPQGCKAARSAAGGFYLGEEGIIYFSGNEPQVVSQKLRRELLALSGLADSVGAFVRGCYYLCIPDEAVMYELNVQEGRFIKYDGIIGVASGDDGLLYLRKSGGEIHSFATDTTQLKNFSFRSPEFVLPDNSEFRQMVVDGCFPVATTIEYYLNNSVKTTKTITEATRKRIAIPVTQEAQNRISIRVSTSAESADTNLAVYGVYLQ